MHPNFTISKILGMFLYRIKAWFFEMSKLRYILWTIIVCVIFIYNLIMLYNLNFSRKIRIDIHIIILSNFTILFSLLLTIISYTLSDLRMHLFQTISDISSRLPQQSYQKLSKLIHAKNIYGFFFQFWLASVYPYFEVSSLFKVFVFFIGSLYFKWICYI